MQSFVIAPAGIKSMWIALLMLSVVLIPVVGVLGLSLIGARNARFDVSAEGLRLRGDLYGRLIPANQLRAEMATRIDLAVTPELQPVRRTLGTGNSNHR